jgi:hypothetical protein
MEEGCVGNQVPGRTVALEKEEEEAEEEKEEKKKKTEEEKETEEEKDNNNNNCTHSINKTTFHRNGDTPLFITETSGDSVSVSDLH